MRACGCACELSCLIRARSCRSDEICTDVDAVRRAVAERGAHSVCCVLSTTSCFAPRAADDVEALARLCKEADIPHLVNHAYGLQCARSTKLIARAARVGRVDACVSSTDKNFMVPVGGAVIGGRLGALAGAEYAGRASSGPVLDLFITALSMGLTGWTALLAKREALFDEVMFIVVCVSTLFVPDTLYRRRNALSLPRPCPDCDCCTRPAIASPWRWRLRARRTLTGP